MHKHRIVPRNIEHRDCNEKMRKERVNFMFDDRRTEVHDGLLFTLKIISSFDDLILMFYSMWNREENYFWLPWACFYISFNSMAIEFRHDEIELKYIEFQYCCVRFAGRCIISTSKSETMRWWKMQHVKEYKEQEKVTWLHIETGLDEEWLIPFTIRCLLVITGILFNNVHNGDFSYQLTRISVASPAMFSFVFISSSDSPLWASH